MPPPGARRFRHLRRAVVADPVARPVTATSTAPGPRRYASPVRSVTWSFAVALVACRRSSRWLADPDAAFAEARRSGRDVLLVFCAVWANPCNELDRELADPDLARLLDERVAAARIDLTDDQPEARRQAETYGAEVVPTLVVLDASGHVLGRADHLLDRDPLLRWLRRVLH